MLEEQERQAKLDEPEQVRQEESQERQYGLGVGD